MVYMDQCGPMRIKSKGWKKYVFVLVDDSTRYTGTLLLASNREAFEALCGLIRKF